MTENLNNNKCSNIECNFILLFNLILNTIKAIKLPKEMINILSGMRILILRKF